MASCTSPRRWRSTSTSSPAAWSTRQRKSDRARSFVADFVRPGGVDRSATAIYADAVEELASLPAPKPEHPARAVRAALTPLAAVSSLALSLRVGKAAVTSKLPGAGSDGLGQCRDRPEVDASELAAPGRGLGALGHGDVTASIPGVSAPARRLEAAEPADCASGAPELADARLSPVQQVEAQAPPTPVAEAPAPR